MTSRHLGSGPSAQPSAERVADAPSEAAVVMAGLIADAFTLWDSADGLDPGEVPEDPSLAECIENDWTLAEFLGLWLTRLPVEQRMEALGLNSSPLVRAGSPTGEFLVRDPASYIPPPIDNPCRVCSHEVEDGYGEKQGRSGWVHWDCLEAEFLNSEEAS